MTQETAPTFSPSTPGVAARRPLWQLPVFLAGVGAVLAVTVGRDLWNLDPSTRFQRDLSTLRGYLDRSAGDSPEAMTLAKQLRERVGDYPDLAGRAHYAVGSVFLARAETDEDPKDFFQTARKQLEKAEELGVPEADRLRLQARLARVWEQADAADPAKVIDYLSKSVDASDSPSEGHRRLAEAYLRQPKPDMAKARGHLQQQLSLAGRGASPKVLALARLELGEIHTKLNEHEEARKALDRVGPDAPPEVYVASRIALAKSYQAEADWTSALRHLEQARDAKGASAASRSTVLYHLGVCYSQAGRKPDAVKSWGLATQGADPEAQASAFRLAESQLADNDRLGAMRSLELSVARTRGGAYLNPLVPANEARALFEQTVQIFRQAGEYENALKLTDLYGKLADQGRDREVAAEVAEAWAAALLAANDAAGANKQFLQAGAAYEKLSAARQGADRGDLLRKAAQQFRRAGDKARALEILEGIAARIPDYPPDKLGEVNFELGEAHLAVGDKAKARLAYQGAADRDGPTRPRARLQLAKLLIEENVADQAMPLLEENLDPRIAAKDAETHQQSLFTLAEAYYQRRDFVSAERRLLEALQFYPASAMATKGRFLLGRCYWYQAAQESRELQKRQQELAGELPEDQKLAITKKAQGHEKQYRELLRKAIPPFDEVEKVLIARNGEGALSPLDSVLLRQASFAVSDAMFFLGDYDQAVQRYQRIAERYPTRVEALTAMSQVWSIHQNNLGDADKAGKALDRMREVFQKMGNEAFDDSTKIHKRAYWVGWFEQLDASQEMK